METGSRDYASKEWLRELNRERGVVGFMDEARKVLLIAAFAAALISGIAAALAGA